MPRIKGTSHAKPPSTTRAQLLGATVELLSTQGFAAATTRAIAAASGSNQALISYHFGSLNNLLLTALDHSSAARHDRYEQALTQASSWREVRTVLRRLYREDRASGHVKLLAEMVAGGLMDRDLGAQVADRVRPWVQLVEDTFQRLLPAAARRRLPVEELAYATVATFLGLELLGSLADDHHRGDAVIDKLTAGRLWNRAAATTPTPP